MLKELINFVHSIFSSRQLLIDLTKNDFRQQYLGSFLGIIWAFIQPLVTILIFLIVFQIAFHAQPVDGTPFFLWLIAGMIPWFFITDAWNTSTNSIVSYSYLVKKIVFRVSLLPIIKILSAIIIHIFFIFFLYLVYLMYGFSYSWYWLQVFYYLFASIALILGVSYLTSSVMVFFKDMGQIVAMLLQLGFWASPVMWQVKMIPPEYLVWLKLNPAFYIIEGYRHSMIDHVGFWVNWQYTLYFWMITAFIFTLGVITFKKLRPHFADVLT